MQHFETPAKSDLQVSAYLKNHFLNDTVWDHLECTHVLQGSLQEAGDMHCTRTLRSALQFPLCPSRTGEESQL